jgi:hypothetical protein
MMPQQFVHDVPEGRALPAIFRLSEGNRGTESCFFLDPSMYSLRHFRAELEAFASAALTAPLGRYLCGDTLDRQDGDGRPVVFVHGLLGSRVHFRHLRGALQLRGIRRFATFCYGPRIDYRTLASELGVFIDDVCKRTGEPTLDVIGHSLGGLVSRYLVETGGGGKIRRLVTLGSPYYGHRFPSRELPIFAAEDLLIGAPEKSARRCVIIPDCGHLGLLHRPDVHQRIAAHLSQPLARPSALPRRSDSSALDSAMRPRSVRLTSREPSRTVTARSRRVKARATS